MVTITDLIIIGLMSAIVAYILYVIKYRQLIKKHEEIAQQMTQHINVTTEIIKKLIEKIENEGSKKP